MSPSSFRPDEARLIEEREKISAADATSVYDDTMISVPAGRCMSILQLSYAPSVNETRAIEAHIYSRANLNHAFFNQSFAFNANGDLAILSQGNELTLYPGDRIRILRDAATAGSTMKMTVRFIMSDLPPMAYIEPQRTIARRRREATFGQGISSMRPGETPLGAPAPTPGFVAPLGGGGGRKGETY